MGIDRLLCGIDGIKDLLSAEGHQLQTSNYDGTDAPRNQGLPTVATMGQEGGAHWAQQSRYLPWALGPVTEWDAHPSHAPCLHCKPRAGCMLVSCTTYPSVAVNRAIRCVSSQILWRTICLIHQQQLHHHSYCSLPSTKSGENAS